MRCRNCLTVCEETATVCSFCRRPLSRSKRQWGSRSVAVYPVVFTAIGIAIFNTFSPRWFPSPAGGFNYERMFWAGVVGGGCALVGGVLGMLLGSSNDEG
jgi:hypothetical protein